MAAYRASTAVVLAELPPERRQGVLEILAREAVSVERCDDGKVVARVRILGPGVDDDRGREAKPIVERAAAAQLPLAAVVDRVESLAAGGVDCALYPRFSLAAAGLGPPEAPRVRPVAWLVRLIEDIYETPPSADQSFPLAVVDAIRGKFGLEPIAAAACWDVVCTTHSARQHHVEVEIFARFLQEVYDARDLDVYLRARDAVKATIKRCSSRTFFKSRWASDLVGPTRTPPPVHLTIPECKTICARLGSSRAVVDANRSTYDVGEFLHLVVLAHRDAARWTEAAIKDHFAPTLDHLPGDVAGEIVAEVHRQAATARTLDDLKPLVDLLATYAADRLRDTP